MGRMAPGDGLGSAIRSLRTCVVCGTAALVCVRVFLRMFRVFVNVCFGKTVRSISRGGNSRRACRPQSRGGRGHNLWLWRPIELLASRSSDSEMSFKLPYEISEYTVTKRKEILLLFLFGLTLGSHRDRHPKSFTKKVKITISNSITSTLLRRKFNAYSPF